MDKNWSEKNQKIQRLLRKEATFDEAICNLIAFRSELFEQIRRIASAYPKSAFSEMPFARANGYHSKTLAYSIWHIFRIEDIVTHTMLARDDQILFQERFLEKIGSTILTTGNELSGSDIADFSRKLDVTELVRYAEAVMHSTNELLRHLRYEDLKARFGDSMRQTLRDSRCISDDPNACWLIDYWCGKNVAGLLRMSFCRHWIMHIEAMRRIEGRILDKAEKLLRA